MDPMPTSLRVHTFAGFLPGPRLLLLGAVHGNETCGATALARLIAELDRGELRLARGTLTVVPVTNPLAFARGQRQADRNLNRSMEPRSAPQNFEDHVANALCPLLESHDVLVDLHSFHAPGEPFIMLGPAANDGDLEPFAHAAAEEELAMHLGPTCIVEGWMHAYALGVERRLSPETAPDEQQRILSYGVGTTEYMRRKGGYALTVECGQHEDPSAPAVAYRAAKQALRVLGLIDEAPEAPADAFEVLRLVDVVDRSHEGDELARSWRSFDAFSAGEILATRASGAEQRAPFDGRMVFPNPAAPPGTEWYYLAARSKRPMPSR
jgi:predicted deacylase